MQNAINTAAANPAAAARQLVEHPSMLGSLLAAGELPRVVDILAEAGLEDHLYRIAHDVRGPVQARQYIKSEVFGMTH